VLNQRLKGGNTRRNGASREVFPLEWLCVDRHSGQLDELDVEGILAFAERFLPRAADLWVQASLEQRQRFQQLFFPEGNCVRRKSVYWNRRNCTGLQLLAGNQNRKGRIGGPDRDRTATS
jgi:hypothetical protein